MNDNLAQKMVEHFAIDFDKADKDNSGTLSPGEVLEVLKNAGYRGSDELAKDLFDQLDKNNDEKITKQEFTDAMFKLPRITRREMHLRKIFMRMDADKSGYLTYKELMDALNKEDLPFISPEETKKLLDEFATDDDGKIYYDEFLEAMEFEESARVLHKVFTLLDKNNSGFLTADEITSAIEKEGEMRKMRPILLQLLANLAKDDDKKISYKEFVAEFLKRREVKKA